MKNVGSRFLWTKEKENKNCEGKISKRKFFTPSVKFWNRLEETLTTTRADNGSDITQHQRYETVAKQLLPSVTVIKWHKTS